MEPAPPCLWSASPPVFLAFISCGYLSCLHKASKYVICTVWARTRDPISHKCRRPLGSVNLSSITGVLKMPKQT